MPGSESGFPQRKPHLMAQPQFRRGFAQLDAFGLSFDAWVYHPQIDELIRTRAISLEIGKTITAKRG